MSKFEIGKSIFFRDCEGPYWDVWDGESGRKVKTFRTIDEAMRFIKEQLGAPDA